MPLIRKPKSKRVKIKDREGLKKKIKDGRKKNKKLAKKNPQWKSRLKKDPGVPNSFPFKDMIIAEAEQAKALEDAEKRRKSGPLKTSEIEALSGFTVLQQKATATESTIEEDEEDEEEAPILLDPSLPNIDAVLDRADVVVHVLDARDPLSHRIPTFEEEVMKREKNLIVLLNKADLVPRATTLAWLSYMRSQNIAAFAFRSATAFLPLPPAELKVKGDGKEVPSDDGLGVKQLKAHLASVKSVGAGLTCAFVGFTNVGKSAVINTIAQSPLQSVYKSHRPDEAGSRTTTLYPRALTIADEDLPQLTLIDTPGFSLIPPSNASEQEESALLTSQILLRRRGRMERMKSPVQAASALVMRANPQDLMVLYNLPSFITTSAQAILTTIARTTNRFHRRDKPDLESAATMLLRDWRTGKFAAYTVPPKGEAENKTYEGDEWIAKNLKSKSELTEMDLVRFKVGEPWPGDVDLKASFVPADDEEDGYEEADGLMMDVDSEEDSSEDEDEGEDPGTSDDGEVFTGFGDISDSDSGASSSAPTLKRSAGKNALIEPLSKGVKQKKSVTFASTKPTKQSKTAIKAEAQAAALAKGRGVKPAKPALKVANQQSARPPKPRAGAKTSSAVDSSEQPYDFSVHF